MSRRTLASLIVAVLAAGGFIACSEEAPTAPTAPLAAPDMGSDLAGVTLEPFAFRAPLAPFQIHQLPDFKIHSKATADIVMQRIVDPPGTGPWHTHPGPSFFLVIEGETKLQRFTEKDGCTETEVFGPGDAFFEAPNEIHRAVVVSAESAVLLGTRFNIPVGGAFRILAADPGC